MSRLKGCFIGIGLVLACIFDCHAVSEPSKIESVQALPTTAIARKDQSRMTQLEGQVKSITDAVKALENKLVQPRNADDSRFTQIEKQMKAIEESVDFLKKKQDETYSKTVASSDAITSLSTYGTYLTVIIGIVALVVPLMTLFVMWKQGKENIRIVKMEAESFIDINSQQLIDRMTGHFKSRIDQWDALISLMMTCRQEYWYWLSDAGEDQIETGRLIRNGIKLDTLIAQLLAEEKNAVLNAMSGLLAIENLPRSLWQLLKKLESRGLYNQADVAIPLHQLQDKIRGCYPDIEECTYV